LPAPGFAAEADQLIALFCWCRPATAALVLRSLIRIRPYRVRRLARIRPFGGDDCLKLGVD
jgi:hypothetical protein